MVRAFEEDQAWRCSKAVIITVMTAVNQCVLWATADICGYEGPQSRPDGSLEGRLGGINLQVGSGSNAT
jgi:hypothetical protein